MSNRNIYTVDQFNTKNRHEEEIVQYVLDNVPDFGPRYSLAKRFIDLHRWPLSNADYGLFRNISDAIYDWCADHEDSTGVKVNPNTIDIERIFEGGKE